MPNINLDFEGVESFDNLPHGKYIGSIDKIELLEAKEEGKFQQMQVSYLVIEGDLTGRRQSEFLSFSPKAKFRLKKWFDLFGVTDMQVNLGFDDESGLLLDPDLIGYDVMFEVYLDPKLYNGEKQTRTRLLEVYEEEGAAEPEPAPAPAPAPVTRPRAAAAAAPAPAGRTARQAAAAPPEPEDDDEGVEAESEPVAAAPVSRRRAAVAAAPTGAPARRSLR